MKVQRPGMSELEQKPNRGYWSLAFVILFVLSPALSAALPPAAELVPAQTSLLLEVPDFAAMKAGFQKTAIYRLLQDPAMADAARHLKSRYLAAVQKQGSPLARAIGAGDVLPGGRLALAFSSAGQGREAVLVLADWQGNGAKIRGVIDRVVADMIAAGGQVERDSYMSADICTIKTAGQQTSGRIDFSTIAYCFVGDELIAANDPGLVRFVLSRMQPGPDQTLALRSDYSNTMQAVGPGRDVIFYLDVQRIIRAAVVDKAGESLQSSLQRLGLDNVVSAGAGVKFAPAPGQSYAGRIFMKTQGAKKGLCAMLEGTAAVCQAPGFIPASAYSLSIINIDIKKTYEQLYGILYSFSPVHAAMMHVLDVPPGPAGEGIDFKNDVVGHLGSQIIIAHILKRPFSIDRDATESLVAIALTDRNSIERAIWRLHAAMADPQSRRQSSGRTIYIFRPPVAPPAAAIGGFTAVGGLAAAVTDTHLLLGSDAAVELSLRCLQGDSVESLASEKWFRRARSAAGTVAQAAVFEDTAATAELLWYLAGRDAAAGHALPSGPAVIGGMLANPLKLKDLPDFETVRKYFGPSVLKMVSRPNGFVFDFAGME